MHGKDAAAMKAWLSDILDAGGAMRPEGYVRSIPRVDTLDLPPGTPVLVRCDLDVKVTSNHVTDDTRLLSCLETLRHCMKQGWRAIVIGHVGREPELTLRPVAEPLSELLGKDVAFLEEWMDEKGLLPAVHEAVKAQKDGSVLVLENTRRHAIERALWKPPEDMDALAKRMLSFSAGFRRLSSVFVNEAIAASSKDASSCVVPFAMDHVALGFHFHRELAGHFAGAMDAQLLVFSGAKMDKLDDLLGIVKRGHARVVITAGALAMALKKAEARMRGTDFCIGKAEKEENAMEKFYVPPERVAQAEEILREAAAHGVRFVMPCDFVLDDRSIVERIPPDGLQMDVGPRTKEAMEREVSRFIGSFGRNDGGAAVFHNGVFGKFEDPRFEAGTAWFMGQLRRMGQAGIRVYVGGGEGGEALRRYGSPSWVAHDFSCGGTILTAMAGEAVAPLKAMSMACGSR